jgi:hypothetical protein
VAASTGRLPTDPRAATYLARTRLLAALKADLDR